MNNPDEKSKKIISDYLSDEYLNLINNKGDNTMSLSIVVSVNDYKSLRDIVEFKKLDYIAEEEDIEIEAGRLFWEYMRSNQQETDKKK